MSQVFAPYIIHDLGLYHAVDSFGATDDFPTLGQAKDALVRWLRSLPESSPAFQFVGMADDPASFAVETY